MNRKNFWVYTQTKIPNLPEMFVPIISYHGIISHSVWYPQPWCICEVIRWTLTMKVGTFFMQLVLQQTFIRNHGEGITLRH